MLSYNLQGTAFSLPKKEAFNYWVPLITKKCFVFIGNYLTKSPVFNDHISIHQYPVYPDMQCVFVI